MSHYFLNEDKSYRQAEALEWAIQLEELVNNDGRHVGEDVINGHRVSTVWIGLDHSFGGEVPLVFETMVFGNSNCETEFYQERYSSWYEALEGHQRAIEWVKKNYPGQN